MKIVNLISSYCKQVCKIISDMKDVLSNYTLLFRSLLVTCIYIITNNYASKIANGDNNIVLAQ